MTPFVGRHAELDRLRRLVSAGDGGLQRHHDAALIQLRATTATAVGLRPLGAQAQALQTHIRSIFRKLGVSSRPSIATWSTAVRASTLR